MAVTDLTDDLPWWTRQGAGPTGGPAATPQGAGGGQQPPGGGNSASWLQYLSQMFGVSPAQAATMMQNPANMPSPNASNMASMTNFGNPAATTGPGPGNVGPVDLDGHGAGDNPPVQPFVVPPAPQGPPGYLGSTGATNGAPVGSIGPTAPPVNAAQGPPGYLGSTSATPPGSPGSGFSPPDLTARAPAAPAAGPAAAAPAAVRGPLATGGAGGVGATSNPRFVQVARPNMSAAGGFGRGGAPQMTALNLAGLFGGGASPAPAGASARVAGPLASGGGTIPRSYPGQGWDIDAQGNPIPSYGNPAGNGPNAPWDYGPLQRGNIWRTSGGPRPRS
jgi:hypothetical protein